MKLTLFALVSLALSLDVAKGQGAPSDLDPGSPALLHPCGTVSPAPAEAIAQEQRTLALAALKPPPPRTAADVVTIPVYYHIAYANQTLQGGYITDKNVQDAVNTLNFGFDGTGFSFKLEGIQRYQNATWFNIEYADPTTDRAEKEMKQQTRIGGGNTLNVWTIGMSRALGYAHYPWTSVIEGVVMRYSVFPGNGDNFRFGKSLTHEVGHWLGLYHTFEGDNCFGTGDFVDDTPAQASATDVFSGCDIRDTCPSQPGADPTWNFMDYASDFCLLLFSAGQTSRMWTNWWTYRA
ncbi:hypothetical protein FA15DRAFT_704724 [Coprinopsis marcescibilis]|uniref:Peptidase M43 pregnancy-associated plasma-A domain-containing protein n=1 Tax=Coprinopsis marcescibilis TaxID=230819 RepID=A0A5C3KUN0_COPMA|nr:hypothetical protein FA15DRAFT_704724 [Coprinopsis marcescibilis]